MDLDEFAELFAGRVAERLAGILTPSARSGLPASGLPASVLPPSGLAASGRLVPEQRVVRAILRRRGDYWTVGYGGLVTQLRHRRGFDHLRRLLANPGTPIHALELFVGSDAPGRPVRAHDDEAPSSWEGGFGPLLDAQAKAAYRRRLVDLEQEVDESSAAGDAVRHERLVGEQQLLMAELARAVGLRGRDRAAGHPAERARVSVTKTTRAAITHIRLHHPACGAHLSAHVQTGTFCCYTAESALTWSL